MKQEELAEKGGLSRYALSRLEMEQVEFVLIRFFQY
jgi:DNA-binding Xre family transcriptional regulator